MTQSGPTVDDQPALRAATARLTDEFREVVSEDVVAQFVTDSWARLARTATTVNFVPVLAECFARQRLQALARVDSHAEDGIPVVLFLCVHNAGRSQMALGWFRHLAGERALGWSGGSEPTGTVNPAAIAAMAEIGIDIAAEFPKPWTEEIVRGADAVITMGCGDACPIFPGNRYEEWDLTDPAGLDVAAVRPIRDEIGRRVHTLLESLRVPVG
jgi:protein-tyrosine-phosphatase